MKQILLYKTWLILFFLKAFLCSSVIAQNLPHFSEVSGTQITNTNGQWVTINPAQPNNIDLIESRIFKLPQRGSGISGIEFIVAGADGGTATLVTRFSKGGGGGLVQLKIDMLNPTLNSYKDLYGKPFLVTFGKKGQSTYAGQGFYTSGGGGGSTGLQWLHPNRYLDPFLAAGGGSGGFSFVYGSLHGNSAINMAPTEGGVSVQHNYFDGVFATGTGNANQMWLVAGGSTAHFSQPIPPICCYNDAKKDAAQSLPYGKFEYQLGGLSASTLQSVIYGQEGGKPTTVFSLDNGNSNTTGAGISFPNTYELRSLGGRGGAGYSGGGAGVSTTTATDVRFSAEGLPTSGAGGTGSPVSAQARAYPNAGDAGYSMWDGVIGTFVSKGSKTQTDNPQSGYIRYRTIADTEAPVCNLTNMTVTLKNGTSPLGYNASVNVADAFQPYIMKPNGFMDNDSIASVAAYNLNGTPITQFDCSMVGTNIPVSITLTDFAGNFTSSLIYVNVIDPFKPIMVSSSSSPTATIDVTTGPVKLTAAHFPQSYDGCKGYSPNNGVTVKFTPWTYYCNDAGSRSVQFHYTDSDGNVSPNYTMTFNVVCSGTPPPSTPGNPPSTPGNPPGGDNSGGSSGTNERILFVDKTASGSNDGSSWADAFTDLQSALTYEQQVSAIFVAAGTYYPTSGTDITQRFYLNQNTKLYGGFPTGGGTFSAFEGRNPEANPTILSGQISSTQNSIYVVITAGNNVVLDGFTIRDGNANGQPYGGGLGLRANINDNGTFSSTIRNCKFTNNHGNYGGAVYVEAINNVIYKVNFENCDFTGNSAVNDGGAAYLKEGTPIFGNTVKFINCIFSQNSAGLQGGAIAYDNFLQSYITNCTFRNNTSQTQGTAIVSRSSLVNIHNSILYGNTSADNTNLQLWASGIGAITAGYSNVQGSGGSTANGAVWSVFGNAYADDICIDTDPLFSASSLKITPQSPCRNAGKNDYNSEVFDISGKSYRINQDVIDMGAYEIDNIVYVAADAPAGGNGQSWATAFNNLNDGIIAAGTGAEQKDVWVKEGTYRPDRVPGSNTITPTNRSNRFNINYTLKIYGGFAGTESSTAQRNIGQHPTILSGDIGTPNNASDNTYHVVSLVAGASRLDGFIIEGGNANGSGENANGGGVTEYGAFTGAMNEVVNCVFRNNQATENGGAWYTKVSIPNNAYTTNFAQNLFYGNSATRGAAVYAAMTSGSPGRTYHQNFYNITAYGNTSSASGAGAFEGYQTPNNFVNIKFYNSLLAGNSPQNYNDVTNSGNITLTNTYAPASATNVFANTSNILGADGKIMTADDGLLPNVLSLAINYGDIALLYNNFLDKDIANQPRIVNIIDAGAYESSHIAPFTADNQGIIYVRTLALGDGTGRNWENATSDLHNAIHATGVQKVFVAIGNYNVGDHSFIMKNGVEIYGGFDPGNNIRTLNDQRIMPDPSNNSQQSSILNGQFVRPVIWNIFDAATAMDNTAVLDGFMLTNGKYTNGAGVRNVYASPTFRNLVITTNRATITGGGMYNQNSSPVLTNVLIDHNGINEILEPNGGQNILGGGIYNTANSNPVLTNVTIADNYLRSNGVSMLGAGMYNNNSSPIVKNSIFWNNRKGFDITSAGVDIENAGTVNLTVKNSITQGYDTGNPADQNKVNVDPNFVNFGTKNFRLSVNSPAIDAGDNTFFAGLNANSKDIANNPRVFDFANNRNIDMGAYEYQCIPVDYSTLTLQSQAFTYNGNPHSLSVKNIPQGVGVAYEITDSLNHTTTGHTATLAGVYTVKATISPLVSGADCEPIVRIATLTIRKAAAIIAATETQNFVYDGTVKNVVASLNHTEDTLSYSPRRGYSETGVYPITVSVPETDNYLAASKIIILAIENDEFAGISLNDTAFTYDGTPKSLTVRGALPASTTVLYTGNQRTDAGTYTVGALLQKTGYNELWLSATLTIHKAPAEITATPVQKYVYDGTVKNVTATLNHSDTTLTFKPQQGYTAPGTYQIFISAAETANYQEVADTVSLVIEKASFSGITLRDTTFTYDGTAKSLVVSGLPADATVAYEGNGKTHAGIYSVKATVSRINYQDSTLTATLKINKAPAVITTAPIQKYVYDGTVKNVVATLNHTETTLTYAPRQGYTATGTYPVIISAASTTNYQAASDTVDLVIEKANLSGIILKDSVFTYDGMPKSLAVSGLPAGATVSYTGNAKTNAGIYTVAATVKRENYQDSLLTATLTIRKAAAVITAVQTQKHVYNGTVKNVAASLNHSETTLTYAPQQGYSASGTYSIIISAAETGNYLKTADTVSLVIENAALAGITLRDSAFTYDGTAKSLAVSGLPPDATVVYEGNGKINAGTYSVKATVSRTNYRDSLLTATLKINKAAAVITAAPTQKHIYDGAVKNVVATLNHTEAALSYSPQQGYSATGTYPVIISAAATANYLAASDTVDLVIEKANLSGIILRDSVFTYDGKPKSLAVTGLPAGAAATYTGNAKTNAGIYTVTATVKRENYQDSLLTATLTIQKAAALITAAPIQKYMYDGTVKNVVATLNHTEATLTYSPQQGYTEGGAYSVIISAAETGNYLKTADTVSLVIENAVLAGITLRDSSFNYDGTAKSLAVSGLPADATIVYEGNGKINAGTYSVKATVKRQNYRDSTLTATLKINKAVALITAAPTQKHIYDGTVKNVVATLNHTDAILSYSPKQGYTAAGIYPVIISAIETTNYLKAADTVNLVIENAGLSGITLRDSTFTYDGKPKSLAVSGLPSSASVTYTGNAKTNAGTYTVTATVKRQNYQDSTLTAILKINKAAALITAAPTQKHVYDGTVKNVAATLNHTEITLTYTPQRGYTAVGTYPVMVSASETANYLAVSDTVSLVIEKAGLTGITFKDSTFIYDGTPKSLAMAGLPADASVEYEGNGKINAGSYTVKATLKRQNYRDSTLTATLKINKAAAVITADAIQNRIYDGTMQKVGASLNHKEALLSYSPAEGYTQAGNYEITISAPESNNYLAASKKVKLVIDKASFQGIVFPNGEFTYNGSMYSLYLSGVPEGSRITFYGNGQVNAGSYSVRALIQKENYHDLELYATLTIHKAQAHISTDAYQAHVYDGSVKNVQAWLNHAETALVYHPGQGYVDAGSYAVTVIAPETQNYLSTSVSVSLFIDKARFQGVTLAGKEFTYNGSPHALAVSGAPEGAQVTYTGNNRVNAGTYKVTALVQMKNYYDLELEADLVIHKAPQTIAFAEIPVTHLENDTDFQLQASSSSGLPVTYSFTYQAEEPPATVTKEGWVELHTSGYVSITAHQPGNENYLPAESVIRILKIISSDATIHRINLGGEIFETPASEIYYLMDCTDDRNQITLQLKTEVGAYVVPGRSLTIDLPKPGIYTQTVVITSQDSTNTLTYHITIEKRFKFENIGVQKFNNLFLVNNNPQTNGGYEFTEYEWLKNGEVIGTGQYYSAGNQSSDILDQGAVYTVRMKTKDGQWLSSCGFSFLPDASFTMGIFPNPVRVGDVLKVKVSDPAEARVSILTLTGQPVLQTFIKAGSGEIKLPSRISAGSYILHYENEKYRRSLPFILEK